MSMGRDHTWAGKKPLRRVAGMSDVLSITADLGYSVTPPPSLKQFSEMLIKATSDYGALTASVADFQWSQNFKDPPTVWREMLCPIPVALASCTRFFEAMTAIRVICQTSNTESRSFLSKSNGRI